MAAAAKDYFWMIDAPNDALHKLDECLAVHCKHYDEQQRKGEKDNDRSN
jgi:hypothetical protein